MIRSKQMDELRGLDKTLRSLGKAKEPSLQYHVMVALTSGEVPKIKAASQISAVARKKIISSGYSSNRNFGFEEIFASCNGYEAEKKQFDSYEKTRQSAVARYSKDADKIMLRALDKEADAEEISEALHEAAEHAGLKALTAPVFDVASSD